MNCRSILAAALALAASATSVHAGLITFDTDPFAGSTALSTPGRQVVGGERFTAFDTAADRFVFDAAVFGVSGPVSLFNGESADLPAQGANVIVLRSFDDDANLATPFGAGNAANLIAAHMSTHGAGFFVYFNQGLNLPRLVFSTDLASSTADLKILARMTNLGGSAGQGALAGFTAANFDIAAASAVPEPGTLVLALPALALCGLAAGARRTRRDAASRPGSEG